MTSRFLLTNLSGRALKVEEFDPNGDLKQSLSTIMLMANQGTEPKEFSVSAGKCFLVTEAQDTGTGEMVDKVINPDPQQNMTVRDRQDVAPVDQASENVSSKDGSSSQNLATADQLSPPGGQRLDQAPTDGGSKSTAPAAGTTSVPGLTNAAKAPSATPAPAGNSKGK